MLLNNEATISLGKPITEPCLIPVKHRSTPICISDPFMVNGKCYKITALSFGTPHGAIFVDDVDGVDVPSLGSMLGTHELFPKGASIVFIQMQDGGNLKARLWQREKGETAFTLEAASVAGTAAMMLQKTEKNEINVFMGGNTFRTQWNRALGEVRLSGPTELFKEYENH